MAGIVVPDTYGEIRMLQCILGIGEPTDNVMKLYSLPTTDPDDSTTLGALTQVTTAGYAAITLSMTGWTVGQSAGITTAQYSEQTFSFSAGASVYGYYVVNGSNELLWLEKFSGAPFVIPDGGGTISLTPRLALS